MKSRYLVDTNAYVRVAHSADCILGDHGGVELRLVPEITAEFDRSARLKSEFRWVYDPPHPSQRNTWTLTIRDVIGAKIKKLRLNWSPAIDDTLADFAAKKKSRGAFSPVLSPPDKAVVFTAMALDFGIVTDEKPMTVVCKEFGIEHLSTVQFLHEMFTRQVLTRTQVDVTVRRWFVDDDAPSGWRAQYKKLFGPPIPESNLP